MFAIRITSLLLLLLTFGLTLATPVLEKRTLDVGRVQTTLNDLRASINPTLVQISQASSNNAEFGRALTLGRQVVDAVDAARRDLRSARRERDVGLEERQVTDRQAVAAQLSDIVSDITTTFNGIQTSSRQEIAGLHGLYTSLDGALGGLLYVVEGLLGGVLKLVAGLLYDVANLLRNLGLGVTRSALQL